MDKPKSIGNFDKHVLNVKRVGEYEILLLKKEPIEGFKANKIWLNKELSQMVKSLAIFVLAPFKGPPLVFGSRKSLTHLRWRGGYLTA